MPAAYPQRVPQRRGRCRSQGRDVDCPSREGLRDHGVVLRRWLAQDDVESGVKPGVTKAENEELKALKRRNRELEMENEALRRAAAYPWPDRIDGARRCRRR